MGIPMSNHGNVFGGNHGLSKKGEHGFAFFCRNPKMTDKSMLQNGHDYGQMIVI